MKLQVFGFAFIVMAAVAGVDYSMQARQSEQSLGFGGYIGSITGRYQATVDDYALKARQKQEVKIHLPEAPDGWVRREWAEADTTGIEVNSSGMSGWERRNLAMLELSVMMGGMVVTNVILAPRMQRKEIWVYERGDEMIALRVTYTKTGAPKRFPGMDDKIDAANLEAMKIAAPYVVLQGVTFGEVWPNFKGAPPIPYRIFSASMGSNVMIAVRAKASDASILELLEMVDYDGLSGMLDLPIGDPDDIQLAATIQDTVDDGVKIETVVVQDEPVKTIGIGFDTIRKMPGQKCARKTGSSFCSGLSN